MPKSKNATELQSCRLRVAPEIAPTVCCGWDFALKRNPQLLLVYVFFFVSVRVLVYLYIVYILLYMYLYLYIIYNIIKNKKKEPTHRVAHIQKKKPKHNLGCGLRFWWKSALQYAVDRFLGATRSLQLCNSVAFLFSAFGAYLCGVFLFICHVFSE